MCAENNLLMRVSVPSGEFSYEFIKILRKTVSAYCRVIRHDDLHLCSTSDIGSVRTQETERLMLSHGYGWHDLLRSRRHDSRSRWLQRLVRQHVRQILGPSAIL
jgi:hypothetical protein